MLLLFQSVVTYTWHKSNRTEDYFQPLHNPVSNSWKGLFKLQQGINKAFPFYLKKTLDSNNEQIGYFSLSDETWKEKYVNEGNFTYLEQLRNISGSVAITNGNYSTNQFSSIPFKGIYYPQLLRGYGTFLFKKGVFDSYEYQQNDTIDNLINQSEWPPQIDQYLTQSDIDDYQTETKCPGYVYFQLNLMNTTKPVKTLNDIYYRIYNDTVYNDDEQIYQQYKANYTVISRDCAFLFQSEIMNIYDQNEQINQFSYFYGIFIVLCIISCILQIIYIFQNNVLFVQDYPFPVLLLWSNSSYLYIVGLICYSITVSYTTRATIMCVFLQAICLISPTLKMALKGIQNHEDASECIRILLILAYVLLGIIVGFVVIIFSLLFNIIHVIVPLCCLMMCYVPLYSLILLFDKKTWQKPLLPFYFIIGENGPKLVFMLYVFCYDKNFGDSETNILCLISLAPLGIFYIIYIVQLFTGAKFGIIPQQAKEDTYNYLNHLLPESEASQFKQLTQNDGTKIFFQPDSWNKCKICKNMTHIHLQNIQNDEESEEKQQQDCFCYIDKDSYQIICPICLCQISLDEYIEQCENSILDNSTDNYVLKQVNSNQQPLLNKDSDQYNPESLSITPCKHCFHRNCLETWLEQHRQCPTCRKQLLLPSFE